MADALFREEAVHARFRQRQRGSGSSVPPPAHWLIASLALLTIAAITALLYFGSYTASDMVFGYLEPENGSVRIVAPRAGILTQLLVRDGDRVAPGSPLARVSVERLLSGKSVDKLVIKSLETELASIDGQLERIGGRQRSQREALAASHAAEAAESEHLTRQLELHDANVALEADELQRLGNLAKRGHLADSELKRQQATQLLLQQGRAELERDLARQYGLIKSRQAQFQELLLRQRDEIAQLEVAKQRALRELANARGMAAFTIDSPVDGVISGLTLRHGDAIKAAASLMTIIPADPRYRAVLMIPSRTIGFLAKGDSVRLRVDAYPYHKFGVIRGTVIAISQTLQLPGEGLAPLPFAEAAYRVRVALDNQTQFTGGKVLALTPGMTVVAEIRRDRRRIVEWLFAPLIAAAATS